MPYELSGKYLFGFVFRVDMTVVQEGRICFLHLHETMATGYDLFDIIERYDRMALDLRVCVLAHCTIAQQFHKIDVEVYLIVVTLRFVVDQRRGLLHLHAKFVNIGPVRAKTHNIRIQELCHYHVLAFFYLMAIAYCHCLQKLQIGYFRLGTLVFKCVDKVLYETIVDFGAQMTVVFEYMSGRLGFPLVGRIVCQVDFLVQQGLIVRIGKAKVLQELVCRLHDYMHALVFMFLVGNLGQIEDYVVHAHVAQ